MSEESKFLKPLSVETIIALIVALVNLALDQADIHNMVVSWISVVACIGLSLDALRRTEWAAKVCYKSIKFATACCVVGFVFVLFGVYLSKHRRTSEGSGDQESHPPTNAQVIPSEDQKPLEGSSSTSQAEQQKSLTTKPLKPKQFNGASNSEKLATKKDLDDLLKKLQDGDAEDRGQLVKEVEFLEASTGTCDQLDDLGRRIEVELLALSRDSGGQDNPKYKAEEQNVLSKYGPQIQVSMRNANETRRQLIEMLTEQKRKEFDNVNVEFAVIMSKAANGVPMTGDEGQIRTCARFLQAMVGEATQALNSKTAAK